ncbi:MAG: hypothetical protein ACK4VZ_12765 [Paracoccaceae bacterium]
MTRPAVRPFLRPPDTLLVHHRQDMTPAPRQLDATILRVCMPGSVHPKGKPMTQIIYIVGAVVIVLALLSFVGLR